MCPTRMHASSPDLEVWADVARLPDKQRRSVALRFLGDLSHREIATVMQISEAAARRNVFEGLNRLRGDLAPIALTRNPDQPSNGEIDSVSTTTHDITSDIHRRVDRA